MKLTVQKMWIVLCIFSLCMGMHVQAAEVGEDSPAILSLYEDGDVVGFIGDSITHAKYCSVNYVMTLYQYYLSRYPDREVEFRNLSAAGYKAGDILNIYDQDPAFRGMNKAVIMLGTNEAILKTPTQDYIRNMELLVEKLKGSGLKAENILILSPPICDERVAGSSKWKFEDRLIEYMGELKSKATLWGVHYLDLHTPMAELTEKMQEKDSKKTLTTGDAIHPSTTGQMLMAYYILQAQGMTRAKAQTLPPKDIYRGKIGQFRTVQQDTLPVAVTEELLEFLDLFEPGNALYEELLRAEGLAEDVSYKVYLGERELGCFTGRELAEGIDLGRLKTNPLQEYAQQIDEKIRAWHQTAVRYRNMWIDVMMQQVTYTQSQIQTKYESFRAADEKLREEIQNLVQDGVGNTYRMVIVEEGYSVEELEQEAEQARKEAEEQARREAEEQARRESEEQARKEAEEQARKESEEQAHKESGEQAQTQAPEQVMGNAKVVALKESCFKIVMAVAGVLALPILIWLLKRKAKRKVS